jgi:uncharacterized protein YjbI with pentapeptide repeats
LGFGEGGEKTGLDLFQVLAAVSVPIVVVLVGANFTATQNKSQQQTEELVAKNQQDIENERLQNEALQSYVEEMGRLILDKDLLNTAAGDTAHHLARARTLTVLEQVDGYHKRSVVQFLYESSLIRQDQGVVVPLRGADLSFAELGKLHTGELSLGGALDIAGAGLSGADLRYAHLDGANLRSADLNGADLTGAYLSDADLSDADLSDADLSQADVTDEQLDAAKSLRGVTMPDGSVHD